MLQTIGCTECGNESNLSVSFSFRARLECCDKCHRITDNEHTFFFCGLKCFAEWFRKIEEDGLQIPCWQCSGTGYVGGFESNGKCLLCEGEKYLSTTKMVGYAKIGA